jgi:hypothetical protein
MDMTLLLIGIVTGIAGLVLLLWFPVKDAWLGWQAKRIMGDMVIAKKVDDWKSSRW